jgi:hypothetical protein
MKTRLIALIMTVFMVISLFAVGASAAGLNYDSAADGAVIYEVNFNGDDNYQPFAFRYADAKMADTKVEVQDDGKTLVATAPSSAGKAWFWGGAIKGLTLGAGKKYTITLQMSFPSGNAGFYFNFGNAAKGNDPLKNNDYNGLYGIYGKLTDTDAKPSFTMSRAAGGKVAAELKSDGSNYNRSPVQIPNGTLADIKVEIDGFFYSVWLKATDAAEWTLYDQLNMTDVTKTFYYPCENLGFSVYLYNNGASTTVKNVVIKKGCEYGAGNSTATAPTALAASKIDYNAAKLGDKLADLNFKATEGAYVPTRIGKNSSATTNISDDGKTYSVQIGDTAAGEWFGSTIGQLKITDNTKYTFKYKLKAANSESTSTYITGIAYNSNAVGTGARYNWYGCFSDTVKKLIKVDGVATAANAVKYAYIGTNFETYNYSDDNQKIFTTFVPKIDADGFIEVAAELNGWTWTYYEVDASGNYVPLQTVDNKALTKAQLGHAAMPDDNLAFIIYTYNKNVSDSVKDVELYKGTVVSVDYTTSTEPDIPVVTGDSAVIIMIIAAVSLLGMGIALKARRA